MSYEFSAQQRRVFDRYSRWLGMLVATFDKTPQVFEARRQSGHQRGALSWDTRLNRVHFYEETLQGHWKRVGNIRTLVSRYVDDLTTFRRESLEITQRSSRSEPLAQVDCRIYSLYRSTNWGGTPPNSVRSLVQELGSRFWSLSGQTTPTHGMIDTMGEAIFGLNAAFLRIMDSPSCACHSQPTVAQELFRNTVTTPAWDIAYSSADPSIRAREYQADVARLFNDFVLLNTQMGVFVKEITLRATGLGNELSQTENMTTMGMLNFKNESALVGAQELLQMLNHFENWFKK
ncbi:hypothetical protein [Pseudomonas sp. NPDC089741]|uniref:hypothetical protein n=1 Tax=Pseudomonas sp. NPDC089741 TaxID=3364470 RepID=UPI003802FD96